MTPLRHKLHALIDAIVDEIEKAAAPDWYDQTNSPLGRRRHLDLARRGVLRSTKDAGKIRIRRADIDAYLLKRTVVKVDPEADEDREVQRVLATMGRKSA